MVILRETNSTKKEMMSDDLQISKNLQMPGELTFENNLALEKKPFFSEVKKIGFAVDIGTTTIAMAGFAFFQEEDHYVCIGKRSAINEQTKFGKDVMMRIMHVLSGKKRELQKLVVNQVEQMAQEILTGVSEEEHLIEMVEEFVIVGNTTMCHLFLGEDVEGLKGTPFRMAYEGNRLTDGKAIGCLFFKKATFFVLSGIASHVGSDALAVLCKTLIEQTHRSNFDTTILAVDLGTNAEILLDHRGELWCCSAAAGPAFEGRGILAGKTAGAGVVTGVKMMLHTGNLILEYLPGSKIHGICGSGLIDLLAELRKVGLIRKDGYLLSKEEVSRNKGLFRWSGYMTEGEKGERAFLIYQGEKDLLLTQTDIRNLQLAKGAIGAAISVLLHETGITAGDLDGLILSGVLGSSIRIKNAMKIGMIPEMDQENVVLAGNAALDGAVDLLLHQKLRQEWEKTAKEVKHLELAGREDFSSELMKFMGMDGKF